MRKRRWSPSRQSPRIEFDSKYWDLIVKRWQGRTGQAATPEGDGRPFDELTAEQ